MEHTSEIYFHTQFAHELIKLQRKMMENIHIQIHTYMMLAHVFFQWHQVDRDEENITPS